MFFCSAISNKVDLNDIIKNVLKFYLLPFTVKKGFTMRSRKL